MASDESHFALAVSLPVVEVSDLRPLFPRRTPRYSDDLGPPFSDHFRTFETRKPMKWKTCEMPLFCGTFPFSATFTFRTIESNSGDRGPENALSAVVYGPHFSRVFCNKILWRICSKYPRKVQRLDLARVITLVDEFVAILDIGLK